MIPITSERLYVKRPTGCAGCKDCHRFHNDVLQALRGASSLISHAHRSVGLTYVFSRTPKKRPGMETSSVPYARSARKFVLIVMEVTNIMFDSHTMNDTLTPEHVVAATLDESSFSSLGKHSLPGLGTQPTMLQRTTSRASVSSRLFTAFYCTNISCSVGCKYC